MYIDQLAFDNKQLKPASSGKMTFRSVVRKFFSLFLAQQIRCGHNWLSENKIFVLCNSPEGHALWSEWFIHRFFVQKVNSSNVNKYKHKI